MFTSIMAIGVTADHIRREATGDRPGMVPLVAAALVLVLVGGLITWWNATVGIALFLVTALLIGLRNPYWLAVIMLAQFAFIPNGGVREERLLFGHRFPDVFQIGMPVLLVLTLLFVFKAKQVRRFIMPDFLILGLGVWGLVGLLLNTSGEAWKHYGNNFLYPMCFYYVVRIPPLDRKKVLQAITILLGCVSAQSILIWRQSSVGASPIYEHFGRFEGFYSATGPFYMNWLAAAFLGLWPALFIYMAATARSKWGRVLSHLGFFLNVFIVTRTMERAPTAALLIVVPLCLLVPRLRRVAIRVMLIGAVAYIPWSQSQRGGALLDRFDETDQSRYAIRRVAYGVLRSPNWDPLLGVGYYQGKRAMAATDMSYVGEDEEIVMWGKRRARISDVAETGRHLHNLYLSLVIEFGIVGALLGAGIGLYVLWCLARYYLASRRDPSTDGALAVAALGVFIVWAVVAYFQNMYSMQAPMSVFWFLCGIVVGHPGVFAGKAEAAATTPSNLRASDSRCLLGGSKTIG